MQGVESAQGRTGTNKLFDSGTADDEIRAMYNERWREVQIMEMRLVEMTNGENCCRRRHETVSRFCVSRPEPIPREHFVSNQRSRLISVSNSSFVCAV